MIYNIYQKKAAKKFRHTYEFVLIRLSFTVKVKWPNYKTLPLLSNFVVL